MSKIPKVTVSAFAALLMMGALTVGAYASDLIETEPASTTATAELLLFEAFSGAIQVSCRVELDIDLHERIPNVPGALVGHVTDVRIVHTDLPEERECDSTIGRTHVDVLGLEESDWHVRLGNITLGTGGTLIVLGAEFNLNFVEAGIECLYSGDVVATGGLSEGEVLDRLSTNQGEIPFGGGHILCPEEGGLEGSFTLSPAVTLILR